MALALLCAVRGVEAQSEDAGASLASTTGELKKLSLEDLANVEVITVARHPQKLSRAASAVQVITAEQIRRSGATSIPEALRLADNLDVAQKNAHDWAISARGFNTALANKLLVLIDGRTVYTPLFSGVFWDVQNTLLADVERIEVISGPGGTQWGANAVNGVINIITRSARDTQGVYAEGAAGNKLNDAVAARYGASAAADAYFRVYVQQFARGDEVLANAGVTAHDAWNQGQGGFRFDAEPSRRTTLTVQGDYYRGREDVVSGNRARVDGGNLLGRWTHVNAGGSDWSLQLYYDRTHLLDPIPAFVINGNVLAPPGFLTDDLATWDADLQYRFELDARDHVQWGAGFRHSRDEVSNAPALAFLPRTLDQNLFSVFVQDEIALGDSVAATIGSKLEHNDYTGLEVEPSVRLQWNVADDQMLWAALSRAVRTPSRIDRDLSEPAPGGLVVLAGSPGFVSEAVIARELGYRGQLGDQLTLNAAAFYNDYQHVRSTSITPTTVLPLFFQNNVEGDTWGVELGVDWQAAANWRLHAGYTPLREHLRVRPGRFDFNGALNETADPRERGALRSALELPHAIEFDAALRYTGARDINSATTIGTVAGYWDLDARLGWHPGNSVEFALVGQNLLHERRVQYGFPGPAQVAIGRAVYGKVVWHF